jgi:hypothetical protein
MENAVRTAFINRYQPALASEGAVELVDTAE